MPKLRPGIRIPKPCFVELLMPNMQWWPGLLSLRDLAADLFGTVFAVSVLVTVESIWGRPSGTRQTPLGTCLYTVVHV